jgi:hypothetical protein
MRVILKEDIDRHKVIFRGKGTMKLTYSMNLSPSWEDAILSAAQEMSQHFM